MTLPISSTVPQNLGGKWFWDEQRNKAAVSLACGFSKTETALQIGVDRSTIYYWLNIEDFSAEVDRLSMMVGVASRAERLRLVNRVVRQQTKEDGTIITEKDILDWLKFAQSETTGAKIDLSKLAEMLVNDGNSEQSSLPPAIDLEPTHQPLLSESTEPSPQDVAGSTIADNNGLVAGAEPSREEP